MKSQGQDNLHLKQWYLQFTIDACIHVQIYMIPVCSYRYWPNFYLDSRSGCRWGQAHARHLSASIDCFCYEHDEVQAH